MSSMVKLYSENIGEISRFLNKFYNTNSQEISNDLIWEKYYDNPIEIVDIIGTFIENYEDFNINMWVNLDDNIYINITKNNANEIIKYIFERFPY